MNVEQAGERQKAPYLLGFRYELTMIDSRSKSTIGLMEANGRDDLVLRRGKVVEREGETSSLRWWGVN